MILIIIETICIIPLIKTWLKADKRQISEDKAITINVAYIIVAAIINWLCSTAFIIGPQLSITSGFYGESINIIGILAAILPPIIIAVIGYVIYLIIIKIKYEKIKKRRN